MKIMIHTDLDDLIIEIDTEPPERADAQAHQDHHTPMHAMLISASRRPVPSMNSITFFYRDVPMMRNVLVGPECMVVQTLINAVAARVEAQQLMEGGDDAPDVG